MTKTSQSTPKEISLDEVSISHMAQLIQKITSNLFSLALAEFHSVGISFVMILGLSISVAVLLLTLWGIINFAIGITLYQAGFTIYLTIGVLAASQLMLALILICMIFSYRKRLFFTATREALNTLKTN